MGSTPKEAEGSPSGAPWDEFTEPALRRVLASGWLANVGVLIENSCGFFSNTNNGTEN